MYLMADRSRVTYFPESNHMLMLDKHDPASAIPAHKSIPVVLERAGVRRTRGESGALEIDLDVLLHDAAAGQDLVRLQEGQRCLTVADLSTQQAAAAGAAEAGATLVFDHHLLLLQARQQGAPIIKVFELVSAACQVDTVTHRCTPLTLAHRRGSGGVYGVSSHQSWKSLRSSALTSASI